jgi:hypothetical protein
VAKTLTDLAGQLAALPDELVKAQRRGVQRGALHVTRAIREEIRAATGGDMKLSGVGRKGARVGARYTVGGTVEPSAVVRATGPLQLIERDTKPHSIVPRPRRGQKRRKALRLANGKFAAAVNHPGTRGKEPFGRGVVRTRGDTGRIFDAEVQAGIRRALR